MVQGLQRLKAILGIPMQVKYMKDYLYKSFYFIYFIALRDKICDVSNCDVLPSCLRPSDFLPYSFDIHHERQPFLSLLKTLLKDMKALITLMLSDIYIYIYIYETK